MDVDDGYALDRARKLFHLSGSRGARRCRTREANGARDSSEGSTAWLKKMRAGPEAGHGERVRRAGTNLGRNVGKCESCER